MPKPAHRPKGSPNKVPSLVKDMIVQALQEEGGVAWLRTLARDEPVAFATLVGKVLPLQITGANGKDLVFNVYTGLPPTGNDDEDAAGATPVPVLGVVSTDG